MEDEKLSGRVIIDTIVDNMRQQVEELRYSKVVPAAFDVYLHADDQQRFESLAHEIAAEAVRALQERLDALNRPSRIDRVRERVGRPRLPFKKIGPWVVRITRDPEAVVPRGRALVVSQIALAGADSFEGQRTRRLAILSPPPDASPDSPAAALDRVSRFGAGIPERSVGGANPGAGATVAPHPVIGSRASEPRTSESRLAAEALLPEARAETGTAELADTVEIPGPPAVAVLTWEDDTGSHRFRMTGREMTVGRAGQGSTADVRLVTLPDVSRLHARITYHAESRSFTIEDLSLLGTQVNGETLERGVPHDLRSPADIRLAEALTLRFESDALR